MRNFTLRFKNAPTIEEFEDSYYGGVRSFKGIIFPKISLLRYPGITSIEGSDLTHVVDKEEVITQYTTKGCCVSGLDFESDTITEVNFSDMALPGCDFSGKKFVRCNFTGTNCRGTNFIRAIFVHCLFDKHTVATKAGFEGAIAYDCDLSVVNFDDCKVVPSDNTQISGLEFKSLNWWEKFHKNSPPHGGHNTRGYYSEASKVTKLLFSLVGLAVIGLFLKNITLTASPDPDFMPPSNNGQLNEKE